MDYIGSRFGDWVTEREIGRGVMGIVYLAHHVNDSERLAAVKVLEHPFARDAVFLFRFESETEILRGLDHPNVVRFLGSGVADGSPFLVMEYVAGSDLEAALRQRGRMPWGMLLGLALQIAAAVKHAHSKAVLHRDLKPSNVMVTPDDEVKVLDFGLATLFGREPIHEPGSVIGSLAYLAPEQATGKPVTKRTDVYALGGLLYTLATGRPPFTGSNVIELLHKHCHTLPERPARLAPDLPHDLDSLIFQMLAKDPADRPGDGSVVLRELERIAGKLQRQGKYEGNSEWKAEENGEVEPAAPSRLQSASGFVPVKMTPLPKPLMSRPLVVIPLFLLFVATFALGLWYAGSGPSAEELFANAQPLIESDDPADWQRAWDESLAELAQRYPDQYTAEVREVRQRLDDLAELRQAMVSRQLPEHRRSSEAERFYTFGLALARGGDRETARAIWQDLVDAFAEVESAQRWVALAQRGLEMRTAEMGSVPPQADPVLLAAIEHIRQLRIDGDSERADQAQQALMALYQRRPDHAEVVEWIENELRP